MLKREELKSLTSVHTQCEDQKKEGEDTFFFEPFDMRKCLRCGLNDKTAKDQCVFHPAMPKFAGGAGNLIYSSEWHQCRESCQGINKDPSRAGCRQ